MATIIRRIRADKPPVAPKIRRIRTCVVQCEASGAGEGQYPQHNPIQSMTSPLYEFTVTNIQGEKKSLADYQGQVLLIVNVASQCGFTSQYGGLEELHRAYQDQGFVVLGFPCNQFGGQEPGSEPEIAEFCSVRFGVTFPMFAKVDVNGDHAHPLFVYLQQELPGLLGTRWIKWNFTKFLVNRQGEPIQRYGSTDTPESLRADIEQALAESPNN